MPHSVEALHDEAIAQFDVALRKAADGLSDISVLAARRALDLELKAAELWLREDGAQPTRSILFKSAAVMALELNDLRKVTDLLASALPGAPPAVLDEVDEISEEVEHRVATLTRLSEENGLLGHFATLSPHRAAAELANLEWIGISLPPVMHSLARGIYERMLEEGNESNVGRFVVELAAQV